MSSANAEALNAQHAQRQEEAKKCANAKELMKVKARMEEAEKE